MIEERIINKKYLRRIDQSIEMIKNMLDNCADFDFVSEVLSRSIEEIKRIQENR